MSLKSKLWKQCINLKLILTMWMGLKHESNAFMNLYFILNIGMSPNYGSTGCKCQGQLAWMTPKIIIKIVMFGQFLERRYMTRCHLKGALHHSAACRQVANVNLPGWHRGSGCKCQLAGITQRFRLQMSTCLDDTEVQAASVNLPG